jgi:ribose-phosphate pyrophosphokinase
VGGGNGSKRTPPSRGTKTPSGTSCFNIPVEHLSAMPLLADHLLRTAAPGSVVVSPDLGAVKRAERYAAQLKLPVAVVHKHRTSGSRSCRSAG